MKLFSINLPVFCGSKCKPLLVAWLALVFLFVACQQSNSVDGLVLSKVGDERITIHPFDTDSGYIFVIPESWNVDSLQIRCTKGALRIDDKTIGQNWTTISVGNSFDVIDENSNTQDHISILRSKLDALFIITSKGSADSITKSEKDSGVLLAMTRDGHIVHDGELSIKGRGNSTWLKADKKPYKIKLNKSYDLFGLRKGKTFNLLAEAFDKTKMHNWLALNIAEEFAIRYPIHSHYVSLWMNGEYFGIYLLTEPVEVDKNGIDIYNLEAETKKLNKKKMKASNMKKFDSRGVMLPDTMAMERAFCSGVVGAQNPSDITGGYVVEFLPWTKSPDNKFNTRYASLCLKSPKYPTIEQMSYLQHRMEAMFDAVIGCNNYEDSHPQWMDYLNIDSYARYYILQELLYGCDACKARVYHVKNIDVCDSLFYAAPAWGFDISMRPLYGDMHYESECYFLRPSKENHTLLFPDLYRYRVFQDTVKTLYYQEFSPILHNWFDDYRIDSLATTLAQDVECDRLRWRESYDYVTEIGELKEFMQRRVAFVDADLCRPRTEYYEVNVAYDFFSTRDCYQWHVTKGDSITLSSFDSYWKKHIGIEDEVGRSYERTFVPTSDVTIRYRWRDATKFEKLDWRLKGKKR